MLRRLTVYVVLAFALYFAVQGGEYSSLDLVRQRSREKMLRASIDSLQHAVDSLTDFKKRVQGDLALQERIAREQYGMVRSDRELLYRFVDPDSVPVTRVPTGRK
ncbi:MAG: septum formation initiator family protein [Gemmatimonadaceae bacterium]